MIKALTDKLKYLHSYFPEILLLISFVLCSQSLDLGWFNTHMSRDLFRAQSWNWLGPEMGLEYKRLPGPLYYWFLALLSVANSIYFVLLTKLIAVYSVIYLLVRQIRTAVPHEILNFFLILFLFMPVFVFTSRNLWNPSLIILFNCLQFYYLFKFIKFPTGKIIYFSTLTAVIGMQVHFSVPLAYLAFGLTVLFSTSTATLFKKIQLKAFCFLLLWLGCWYAFNYVPEFNDQIIRHYGFNLNLLKRLDDITWNLGVNLYGIADYDLFAVFFNALVSVELVNKDLVLFFADFFGVLYLILFFISLAVVVREFHRHRRTLDLFLIIFNLLFLLSILTFQKKENIPYRYGLALFPFQFFLISYGTYLLWNTKKMYSAFKLLAVCTLVFYIYFNFKILKAMSLTGRAHHTHNDNLEMTFKNKEMLYRFLQKNVALEGDPFNYLHGRAANKFRLNEMNWHQTTPYYSLYYFTTGQKFSFTDQMINFENPDNWLVQLKNIKELKENPDGALKLTEMGSDVFPRKLVVTYLDINKKIVHSIPWKNTSLILVSAFVPDLMPVKFVQLDFEMDTSVHNYVNLLIDDNAEFGFAYSINYNLLEFTLDKVVQYPQKTYKGFFLVQNQYIYETKRNPNGRFKLLIELKAKYPNFSRIEIFATDKIMSEEELFPKENRKP